ncbi:MAG: beta-ketoacyl-[acyl-carrier-protein] synthase family protein [Candidatus Omnitrophica bacterium]|nr:beta-ketoacyl-[acyl-carrier-protein] synthase family protein [Candidatus Omnitrophota bacterium]
MNKQPRVVVTGIGIVSSIGTGRKPFWKALTAGTSGISRITTFDTTGFKCQFGGEVHDFAPERYIEKRRVKFLGRASQLAIAASSLAIEDAGLVPDSLANSKTAVLLGTTMGEKPLEDLVQSWVKVGIRDLDRRRILQASANNLSANVALYFKTKGQNYLFPTACAAGNYAIGYGYDLIRNDGIDYVLAGGSDAFFYVAYIGFQRLYAMSPDRCQPFDKNRKGMMLGEGSGMLILERLESALDRGADIYAEVLGYGLSCDAFHPTAPDPVGLAKSMKNALAQSGLTYTDVDLICSHGTGTPSNDKAEAQAIKSVFKDRAKRIPANSIKSMLGHCMGAASAIEAASCCLAIKDGIIPPTINYETPDPECDIDCVPNIARRKTVNVALNNGFAFGGNNSCLVLRKFKK